MKQINKFLISDTQPNIDCGWLKPLNNGGFEILIHNGVKWIKANKIEDYINIYGTYNEIYTLYKNSKLIPDYKYHITDYRFITTLNDTIIGTEESGYPSDNFELVLTAISNNAFNKRIVAIPQKNSFKYYLTQLDKFDIEYDINHEIAEDKGVITYMKDFANNEMPFDIYNQRQYITDEVKTQYSIPTNFPYLFGGTEQWNSTYDDSKTTFYENKIENVDCFKGNYLNYESAFHNNEFGKTAIFKNNIITASYTYISNCILSNGSYINNCILSGSGSNISTCTLSGNNSYISYCTLSGEDSIINYCTLNGDHSAIQSCVLSGNCSNINSCTLSGNYSIIVSCKLLGNGSNIFNCILNGNSSNISSCILEQSTISNCTLSGNDSNINSCVLYGDHSAIQSCVLSGNCSRIKYCTLIDPFASITNCILSNEDSSIAYYILSDDFCIDHYILNGLIYIDYLFNCDNINIINEVINYNYYISKSQLDNIQNTDTIIEIRYLSNTLAIIKSINNTTGVESNTVATIPTIPSIGLGIINITATTLDLTTTNLKGSESVKNFGYEYKLSTDTNYITTDHFIKELTADTSYDIRAFATTSSGKYYSKVITIKTLAQ